MELESAHQKYRKPKSFFFFFCLSYLHIAYTLRSTQVWVFYHHEEQNGLLRLDRSPLHPFAQPAVPFVRCDSFVSLPSCDSKYEEAGLLQCLVNERMSLGRSDGVRSTDKIVRVGCYENREIMLLGGQSVGGTGKKNIVPQLKICWTLNQRQTARCICRHDGFFS